MNLGPVAVAEAVEESTAKAFDIDELREPVRVPFSIS